MKRLVWLLPLAFVLMWGGVLLDTGRPATSARTKPAEPEVQEEAEPPAPEPAVAAAAPAERAPQPQPLAAPPVRAVDMRAAAMRALAAQSARTADGRPMGRAERVGGMVQSLVQSAATTLKDVQAEASPEELLGEHGEGVTSPQFVQLETDYTSEPRDGAWAIAEERRIASLLQQHPISGELRLLNCQDSVCRIMLETKSKDSFERLLSVPGLAEATGLSSSSPYSLRSGQLSVYYRRNDSATASKTKR